MIFDEEEEYREYIVSVTRKIVADDTEYSAFNNRGVASAELGENQAALDDFTVSCELATRNCIPFLNRAELLAQMGDLIGALDFATQAIYITPTNCSCYFVRAGIYDRLGEKLHAEEDRRAGNQYRADWRTEPLQPDGPTMAAPDATLRCLS